MRQYTDDQRMEKYLHLHITLHTNTFLCLELLRYNAHKKDALYIWGTGASRTCAFMCHLRRWCTWRPRRLYDLSNLALIKFNTVFFKSRRNWNYQMPHFHWACCWKKNTFDLISGMNPNTSVGSTGVRVRIPQWVVPGSSTRSRLLGCICPSGTRRFWWQFLPTNELFITHIRKLHPRKKLLCPVFQFPMCSCTGHLREKLRKNKTRKPKHKEKGKESRRLNVQFSFHFKKTYVQCGYVVF